MAASRTSLGCQNARFQTPALIDHGQRLRCAWRGHERGPDPPAHNASGCGGIDIVLRSCSCGPTTKERRQPPQQAGQASHREARQPWPGAATLPSSWPLPRCRQASRPAKQRTPISRGPIRRSLHWRTQQLKLLRPGVARSGQKRPPAGAERSPISAKSCRRLSSAKRETQGRSCQPGSRRASCRRFDR
jgi:hypothetical protein